MYFSLVYLDRIAITLVLGQCAFYTQRISQFWSVIFQAHSHHSDDWLPYWTAQTQAVREPLTNGILSSSLKLLGFDPQSLNFTVHTNLLGPLLNCRWWPRRPGWGRRLWFLTSSQVTPVSRGPDLSSEGVEERCLWGRQDHPQEPQKGWVGHWHLVDGISDAGYSSVHRPGLLPPWRCNVPGHTDADGGKFITSEVNTVFHRNMATPRHREAEGHALSGSWVTPFTTRAGNEQIGFQKLGSGTSKYMWDLCVLWFSKQSKCKELWYPFPEV